MESKTHTYVVALQFKSQALQVLDEPRSPRVVRVAVMRPKSAEVTVRLGCAKLG